METATSLNRCRYSSLCRFYQRNGYTCNDEEEACTYCSAYDIFEKFRPPKAPISA